MKTLKRAGYFLLGLVVLIFLFGIWYNYRYSMDEVIPYEINTTGQAGKILIATQGSPFKDEVTKNIVDRFEPDAHYIKVIDVSGLAREDPEEYDVVVLMHTCEMWKPPKSVEAFVTAYEPLDDNVIVLTTSGDSTYKMEGVDALTGASIMSTVESYSDEIILKMETHLNSDKNRP